MHANPRGGTPTAGRAESSACSGPGLGAEGDGRVKDSKKVTCWQVTAAWHPSFLPYLIAHVLQK